MGEDCSDHICTNSKETHKVSAGGFTLYENKLPKSKGPLNAMQLGNAAWPLLHRMTLSYPTRPTEEQKTSMLKFIKALGWLYPCKICATDFRDKIVEFPPELDSREDFALWMCK
jgi:mitochondrial FAD-linked sulfhydryl oxidase